MPYNAYNLSVFTNAISLSGAHHYQCSIVILLIFTMSEHQDETKCKFETYLCLGPEPQPPYSLSGGSSSDDGVTIRVPKVR